MAALNRVELFNRILRKFNAGCEKPSGVFESTAQVLIFWRNDAPGLDNELHHLQPSFGRSIQLTRYGDEPDPKTSEEKQESRAGQEIGTQEPADECAQLDGEVVSDRNRSKF
jgi:hypothetical protein